MNVVGDDGAYVRFPTPEELVPSILIIQVTQVLPVLIISHDVGA
jgi:hypothetical protein